MTISPPGFTTLPSSESPATGSVTEQKTNVATAKSNESSGNSRRYASGEINEEEFEEIKAKLGG